MRRPTHRTRTLGCETLERRDLMSGNTAAWVEHGILKVVGDDLPNRVEIREGSRPDEFIIDGKSYGGSDTLINGSRWAQRIGGVTQGVQVLLHGGNDHLKVYGKSGSDKLAIPGPVGLGIDLGTGNDILYVQQTVVDGSSGISGQAGDDKVYVRDSYFAWDLIVDTKSGRDYVNVTRTTAAHFMMVGTGSDDDQLRLDAAGAAWIYVEMGAGNDYASISHSHSALRPGLDGGPGYDRIWLYNNYFKPYLKDWERTN